MSIGGVDGLDIAFSSEQLRGEIMGVGGITGIGGIIRADR